MELRSSPQHRRNSFSGKGIVIVSILLILTSFAFFFEDFLPFLSRSPTSLHRQFSRHWRGGRRHDSSSGNSEKKKKAVITCDYSDGIWVWDKNHWFDPYTEDCPFMDPGFRCRRNGRRNSSYLHWRWQPHGCNLPRFDGKDMLEMSRNRNIIFAGDSIGRNQWESMVCLLAGAAKNRSRISEQNGNPITKHKGYLSIVFSDYNLTVEYYRTPFLVVVDHPPPNSGDRILRAIRLDTLHWRSSRWVDADVLVFNPGHWWSKEKTTEMGNYFQVGKVIETAMDVREAFRRSLQTLTKWTVDNLNLEKSYVFLESNAPQHYINGEWDNGGTCAAETWPTSSGDDGFSPQPEPWNNEIISGAATAMRASWGRNVQFVNITYLTELRRDGHPSVHRERGTPADAPEDCSHWCLPGVPDTWNEILYAHLVSMGYGSKSSSTS